ncbi:MAG: DNA gyrase inhibitor YacG [Sedimentisphaerales bacterium]|nr:DNA gyrase inhibitor YacG [Sedimentisphaerales bacterium]
MKHRCPICNKIVKASLTEKSEEAKFFPFCSQRCKYIDLGVWLDAEYKIISTDQSQESEEPTETTPAPPDMM